MSIYINRTPNSILGSSSSYPARSHPNAPKTEAELEAELEAERLAAEEEARVQAELGESESYAEKLTVMFGKTPEEYAMDKISTETMALYNTSQALLGGEFDASNLANESDAMELAGVAANAAATVEQEFNYAEQQLLETQSRYGITGGAAQKSLTELSLQKDQAMVQNTQAATAEWATFMATAKQSEAAVDVSNRMSLQQLVVNATKDIGQIGEYGEFDGQMFSDLAKSFGASDEEIEMILGMSKDAAVSYYNRMKYDSDTTSTE